MTTFVFVVLACIAFVGLMLVVLGQVKWRRQEAAFKSSFGGIAPPSRKKHDLRRQFLTPLVDAMLLDFARPVAESCFAKRNNIKILRLIDSPFEDCAEEVKDLLRETRESRHKLERAWNAANYFGFDVKSQFDYLKHFAPGWCKSDI